MGLGPWAHFGPKYLFKFNLIYLFSGFLPGPEKRGVYVYFVYPPTGYTPLFSELETCGMEGKQLKLHNTQINECIDSRIRRLRTSLLA